MGRPSPARMAAIDSSSIPAATALAVEQYAMNNQHAASMCLMQAPPSSGSASAAYRTILLEAYGLYTKRPVRPGRADQDSSPASGRRNRPHGERLGHMQVMETAYGMVSKEKSFPYAERCPEVDYTDTRLTTRRANARTPGVER